MRIDVDHVVAFLGPLLDLWEAARLRVGARFVRKPKKPIKNDGRLSRYTRTVPGVRG
jgi:hypothetical protein